MQSLIIAFAMYSKIPMPRADWEDRHMRYVFCWFPLIGLVIGLAELAGFWLLNRLQFGSFFRGAVMTAVPLLMTGGIHLDGFMDTTDARSSYGDREKKLAILKDSHVGAFAVMGCGVYLLLTAGAWSELQQRGVVLMAGGFILERALSGLAAVHFPGARKEGMLSSFREPAGKRTVTAVLTVVFLVTAVLMLRYWMPGGIACVLAALAVWAGYYHMAVREFGGITGDLAGWFLQRCELAMLLVLAVVSRIG